MIDDASIDKLKKRWPLKREVYAELIKKINEGHPKLIALDLVFSGKSSPVDDFKLREAIAEAGNVVLASLVKHRLGHFSPQ